MVHDPVAILELWDHTVRNFEAPTARCTPHNLISSMAASGHTSVPSPPEVPSSFCALLRFNLNIHLASQTASSEIQEPPQCGLRAPEPCYLRAEAFTIEGLWGGGMSLTSEAGCATLTSPSSSSHTCFSHHILFPGIKQCVTKSRILL